MTDAELLAEVLEREDLSDDRRRRFEDMQKKLRVYGKLLSKQRAFAEAVLKGEAYEPEPVYENLVSSGRVARGREVELMVRDKPLRPPTRRTT